MGRPGPARRAELGKEQERVGVGGRWGVEGKEREKERSRDGEAAAMLGSVVKGHVGAGLVGAPRGSSLGHQQAQVQKPRERER